MKARTVNEAMGDILKPKSESDIFKELDSLSEEELYDLWYDTRNVEIIKYAIKNKKMGNFIGEQEIAEIINDYPDLKPDLLPIIKEKFNDWFYIQLKNNVLEMDGWEDLIDVFGGGDMSREHIEQILQGDGFEIFYEPQMFARMPLSEYDWYISKMDHMDESEIKDFALNELNRKGKDTSELEDIYGFSPFFEYVSENPEELPDTTNLLQRAITETQAYADEAKAYEYLVKQIKNKFKFGDPVPKKDKMVLPIDDDQIVEMFLLISGVEDRIPADEPPNGFGGSGDFENFSDTFEESLSNVLADELYDLQESLQSILAPKSSDEVFQSFKELPISGQIEFLYDNPKDMIPVEHWPLIHQIKERLKNNPAFDADFRVTSTEHGEWGTDYTWSYFRIHPRMYDTDPVIVSQYNNEPHSIRVYIKNDEENEQIIEDYQGFMKWFNDDYVYKEQVVPYSIKETMISNWENYNEDVEAAIDRILNSAAGRHWPENVAGYVHSMVKQGRDPKTLSWVGFADRMEGRVSGG